MCWQSADYDLDLAADQYHPQVSILNLSVQQYYHHTILFYIPKLVRQVFILRGQAQFIRLLSQSYTDICNFYF